VKLFQLFSKLWPTSETFEYFPYLEETSYCEKLMGKILAIFSPLKHEFLQMRMNIIMVTIGKKVTS